MALEEFTVQKDTGYVPQATVDMGAGQVDEIERQAKAQVTSAKVEGAQSQKAKSDAAGAAAPGSNPEAKVYGDLITGAMGLGNVSSFMEAIGTRMGDHAQMKGGPHPAHTEAAPGKPRHIEADIFSASRKPGLYRAPASQEKFGAGQAAPNLSNIGIVEKVGLTGASLHGEKGSGNLNTWAKKPFESTKVESVPKQVKALELQSKAELSQQTTFSKQNANEQALDSVIKVRAQQSAMVAKAQELAPGMGSGPKFNASQYLSDARDESGKA